MSTNMKLYHECQIVGCISCDAIRYDLTASLIHPNADKMDYNPTIDCVDRFKILQYDIPWYRKFDIEWNMIYNIDCDLTATD